VKKAGAKMEDLLLEGGGYSSSDDSDQEPTREATLTNPTVDVPLATTPGVSFTKNPLVMVQRWKSFYIPASRAFSGLAQDPLPTASPWYKTTHPSIGQQHPSEDPTQTASISLIPKYHLQPTDPPPQGGAPQSSSSNIYGNTDRERLPPVRLMGRADFEKKQKELFVVLTLYLMVRS
jgi:hypothetical protein